MTSRSFSSKSYNCNKASLLDSVLLMILIWNSLSKSQATPFSHANGCNCMHGNWTVFGSSSASSQYIGTSSNSFSLLMASLMYSSIFMIFAFPISIMTSPSYSFSCYEIHVDILFITIVFNVGEISFDCRVYLP